LIDGRYDTGVGINSYNVGEYVEARFIEP